MTTEAETRLNGPDMFTCERYQGKLRLSKKACIKRQNLDWTLSINEQFDKCRDCRQGKKIIAEVWPEMLAGEKKKICKKCLEPKLLTQFYTAPTSLDGHDSTCKECRSDIAKEKRRSVREAKEARKEKVTILPDQEAQQPPESPTKQEKPATETKETTYPEVVTDSVREVLDTMERNEFILPDLFEFFGITDEDREKKDKLGFIMKHLCSMSEIERISIGRGRGIHSVYRRLTVTRDMRFPKVRTKEEVIGERIVELMNYLTLRVKLQEVSGEDCGYFDELIERWRELTGREG